MADRLGSQMSGPKPTGYGRVKHADERVEGTVYGLHGLQ